MGRGIRQDPAGVGLNFTASQPDPSVLVAPAITIPLAYAVSALRNSNDDLPRLRSGESFSINQHNGALGGVGSYLNNVNRRIDDVENKADAGTAGAMAMAGMPQAYTPGKSMVAAGAATYQGQTSIAIGVSRLSDNGTWVLKVNGSANSRGKVGMAVGAGYQW